ncbi:MAG: hypothetical protein HY897_08675 [Deltaproteobacteria bacterium]|nr:hypothetical protein [Deltaproteobacteria bacterium]
MKGIAIAVTAAGCAGLLWLGCDSRGFSPTEGGVVPRQRDRSLDGGFPAPDGPTGAAAGIVYAANAESRIAGVKAYAEYQGVETLTGPAGDFVLGGIPVGRQIIHFEKGIFATTVEAVIEEGMTTYIDVPIALEVDAGKIAIVRGSYDSIEEVLERLGYYGFAMYNGMGWDASSEKNIATLVGNAREMEKYYAVFLNCGVSTDGATDPEVKAALRAYTAGGGKLYASDWAYDYVEQAFPDHITFFGDDLTPHSAAAGMSGVIPGIVMDGPLGAYLGKSEVELNYNLGQWVVTTDSGPETKVYVKGNVPDPEVPGAPLLVSFSEGDQGGRVVYTTFHNEAQTSADMDAILEFLVFDF